MTKVLINIKEHNKTFVVLILSLFITYRYITPLVIIRPFDLLTAIIFLFLFFADIETKEKKPPGFYYILPFLIIHITSALLVSFDHFLRESIQVILIIMFAYVISKLRSKINYKKVIYYLLIGSAFFVSYVIYWHISKGIIVGWKQLPDSRILFTVVSIFLFSYLNTIEISQTNKFIIFLMFIGFFSILLMSGERKALLVFLFLLLMHYTYGFPIRSIITIVIGYFILLYVANSIDNAYVARILNSLIRLNETGNVNYTLDTGTLKEADSFSNLQRVFAFDVSKSLFLENPIIGVGTNNFVPTLEYRYPQLPIFLKGGIHSEFLRILIENGLVGLFFYLMIWYKSWIRTKETLMEASKNGLIDKRQIVFLLYTVYFCLAIYVGTEASSTRSFIILVIISILPDYLIHHLKKGFSK